jgi:RNA polymerase sigma-70 factor (ECF subfamily)
VTRQEISKLYNDYSRDVYRLALSYLHSKHDAEDICQSVFLKLLEKDVTLLPDREKAWLLTCTANACKNHLSSFWRKNIQALDDKLVFASPEEQDLWQQLLILSPKDRALIHLYYYEGYSQEEIGQILGITRTAVQTRMQRARQKLRKELLQDA